MSDLAKQLASQSWQKQNRQTREPPQHTMRPPVTGLVKLRFIETVRRYPSVTWACAAK